MILGSGMASVWSIIRLILVFIFIIILTYYAAKLTGKYQSNVLNSKSNIKIIESFRVGNNKFLAIAKIAGEYYAIGVGKDEVTLIDKLDKDTLDRLEEEKLSAKSDKGSFKDILSDIKKDKQEKK